MEEQSAHTTLVPHQTTPCGRLGGLECWDSVCIPDLSSLSSSTLNAVNFAGSTPCIPSIWIDVLEKPHWGVSGVPFMKRTTGAEATALSIAVRTSCDRRRVWRRWCDIRGWREEAVA